LEEEHFHGCTGLKDDLVVPDAVKTIGDGAFGDCNFSTITVNPSIEGSPWGCKAEIIPKK